MSEAKPVPRKFRRVAFKAPAQVTTPEGRWATRILDISLKGVLIEQPKNWPAASVNGACHIDLPLDDEETIRLDGRITRQGNGHLGFQWTDIDATSLSHLRRLLELNLGDSKLIDRELSALSSPD